MSYSAHLHLLMPWKRHLTTAFLHTVIYNKTWKMHLLDIAAFGDVFQMKCKEQKAK